MCGRVPLIGSVAPGSLHLAGHLSELGGVRPPADVMGLVLCEGGGSLSLPPTAPQVLPIPFPHVRRLLLSPPGWARGPVLAISPFTGCCPKTHLESPLFPERWSHPQPTTESLSLASCLLTHKCVCVGGGGTTAAFAAISVSALFKAPPALAPGGARALGHVLYCG